MSAALPWITVLIAWTNGANSGQSADNSAIPKVYLILYTHLPLCLAPLCTIIRIYIVQVPSMCGNSCISIDTASPLPCKDTYLRRPEIVLTYDFLLAKSFVSSIHGFIRLNLAKKSVINCCASALLMDNFVATWFALIP